MGFTLETPTMKLLATLLAAASASEFSQIIEKVNTANANWVAGENFPEGTKISDLKQRMGAKSNKEYDNDRPYPHFDMFEGLEVPDTFDARTNWPKCTVIGKVRDQGGCGSCWAFGAAESISDRICIASEGKVDVMYAAEDILSCCQEMRLKSMLFDLFDIKKRCNTKFTAICIPMKFFKIFKKLYLINGF